MIEIKEKSIEDGMDRAKARALKNNKSVLFSYSFRFDIRDVLPLLTHPIDKDTIRIYWTHPLKGISYAGLGSVLIYKADNMRSFMKMKKEVLNSMILGVSISDNALIGPRLIGGVAFNQYSGEDNTWKDFPRSQFHLSECLATLNDDGAWLTISRLVNKNDIISDICSKFKRTVSYYQNRLPVTLPPISKVSVDKYRDVPSKEEYSNIIFSVLNQIKPGKMEKVVISRSHHVKVEKDFKVVSAMQVLRNAYPNCVSFCFSFPNEGIFFGSTPERLIKLKNGFIQTEALAGTTPRGKNMEEDRILSESLLSSHKEREEHNLVLEQILRKLDRVIDNIEYSKIPQIMKLKNVQHLHTSISGELNCKKTVLDLVSILHPTSAVAGTPTYDAMNLISKMEMHDRGWYSGPIGIIDENGDGEFYVALRSALVKDKEAHVFAGGGIVSESHPEKEWNETELKLQPILSALSGGQI